MPPRALGDRKGVVARRRPNGQPGAHRGQGTASAGSSETKTHKTHKYSCMRACMLWLTMIDMFDSDFMVHVPICSTLMFGHGWFWPWPRLFRPMFFFANAAVPESKPCVLNPKRVFWVSESGLCLARCWFVAPPRGAGRHSQANLAPASKTWVTPRAKGTKSRSTLRSTMPSERAWSVPFY